MTNTQRKVLEFLASGSKPNAQGVAILLWPERKPDSGSYHTRRGYWLSAGSYMGKLVNKGWVRRDFKTCSYEITQEGRDLLKSDS
jgi:hypothetical protein